MPQQMKKGKGRGKSVERKTRGRSRSKSKETEIQAVSKATNSPNLRNSQRLSKRKLSEVNQDHSQTRHKRKGAVGVIDDQESSQTRSSVGHDDSNSQNLQ